MSVELDEARDQEMIRLFMDSFHAQSEEATWPEIRELGLVPKYSEVKFTQVFETSRMYVRKSSMPPMSVKAAAPALRKFLQGRNEPTIDRVVDAVDRLGLPVDLEEVRSFWHQLTDRRFEFVLGANGQSLGVEFDSEFVRWDEDAEIPSKDQRIRAGVSLLDFVEVYWNEGELHAFRPGRNERVRAIVREIPSSFQEVMMDMAISATLYSIIILHYQLRETFLDGKRLCGANCQEERIRLHLQRSGQAK